MRLSRLPQLDRPIRVLDAFAGRGLIWNEVRRRSDLDIDVTSIEKDRYKAAPGCLIGDNVKFMRSMDLSRFDVVDLDDYGVPFDQAEELFRQHGVKPFECVVHVTAIMRALGSVCYGMLKSVGISARMVKRSRTLVSRRGEEILFRWLASRGVRSAEVRKDAGSKLKKIYFSFRLTEALQDGSMLVDINQGG